MIKGSLLSLLVLALSACQGDSSPTPVAQITPTKPHAPLQPKGGPTSEELTAGMVEAVTLGKSPIPLSIKFDLPKRPVVGQSLDVVVAVIPQSAISSVTVQPTSGDGLQVAANVGTIEIQSLDPSQVYRLSIPVTPSSEGVHLLGLKVSLKQDDAIDTGTFAVPVIVSAAGEGVPAPGAAPVAPSASTAAGKH